MIIAIIPIVLFSAAIHEYCHGWMANKLGDPTAKSSGRLTLNPLAHIDTWGTIILPLLLLLVSTRLGHPFAMGYAKPVPLNPNHFKNPKNDIRWVGLAGPAANFLIAVFFSLLWKLKIPLFSELIAWVIFVNIIFAIFNLLPIPPLDGSKIAASFLPNRLAHNYLRVGTYGFFFIIFLLILTRFFDWFLLPMASLTLHLLGVKIII